MGLFMLFREAFFARCFHIRPSRVTAIFYCLSLSVSFVASLYLVVPTPIQQLNRDDPRQIKWRTLSVAFVCIGAIASYPLFFCVFESRMSLPSSAAQMMGWSPHVQSVPIVLFHVTLLYLGPITEAIYDLHIFNLQDLARWVRYNFSSIFANDESKRWQHIRSFVTAPIAEEIVFRGCMVPVLLASAIQEMRVIFLVPLFFGVAHAHHAMQRYKAGVPWKQILMGGIFQFAYTSLFGSYVAFVLLRTGSIVCAIVCHSYCNYMGLPGFYFLQRRGTAQIFVGMMYLAGMLLFARGFSLIDSTNSLSHTIMKSLV